MFELNPIFPKLGHPPASLPLLWFCDLRKVDEVLLQLLFSSFLRWASLPPRPPQLLQVLHRPELQRRPSRVAWVVRHLQAAAFPLVLVVYRPPAHFAVVVVPRSVRHELVFVVLEGLHHCVGFSNTS